MSSEFVIGASPHVRSYVGYVESGEPVVRVEVPPCEPVLVISLGPAIDVDGVPFSSFVGGLDDRSWRVSAGLPIRTRPGRRARVACAV